MHVAAGRCTYHRRYPRSRVQCAQEVRTRAYRAAEAIRHSLRNGFTAYNVLSPENGSFASVAPRETVASGCIDVSTATSGPHVFAVRSHAVRCRHYQRPSHPAPRFVAIMIRPLCPKNLSECANGRFSKNRPLLELSPLRPKAMEPVSERGTAPVSSSTRTVARASSPNQARKGVDDGTK